LEEQFFLKLASLESMIGLELPIWQGAALHKYDEQWLLHQFKTVGSKWNFVFTCIPGTMDTLKDDPVFGLASNDKDGRQRAVNFIRVVLNHVQQVNKNSGRKSVIAVQIHSAPKLGLQNISSSKESFLHSLKEIRSWDWQGAVIAVEHCDCYRANQLGSKQFLSLEDEVWAIECSNENNNTRAGITINWGRSAVEGRSAQMPLQHLQLMRKHTNRVPLFGLMFSGVSPVDNPIYGQWLDNHTPFSESSNSKCSILNAAEAKAAIQESNWRDLLYIGIKIMPQPMDLSIDEKLIFFKDAISILNKAKL